jgi:hypothetical protein
VQRSKLDPSHCVSPVHLVSFSLQEKCGCPVQRTGGSGVDLSFTLTKSAPAPLRCLGLTFFGRSGCCCVSLISSSNRFISTLVSAFGKLRDLRSPIPYHRAPDKPSACRSACACQTSKQTIARTSHLGANIQYAKSDVPHALAGGLSLVQGLLQTIPVATS